MAETFDLWQGEIPGGAYHGLAAHEGKDYAEFLNSIIIFSNPRNGVKNGDVYTFILKTNCRA